MSHDHAEVARPDDARIRVLLADEHGVLRDGLRALLGRCEDISVVAAVNSGGDAVREAVRLSPNVVIMGVSMPVMSGIEASHALAKEAPAIAVLILSMHSSPEMIQLAVRAGARGYMTKEASGEELIGAIRSVAAGKRYAGNRVAEALYDLHQGGGENILDRISRTEVEVLRLVAEGRPNSEVAEILRLSPRTVETYRHRLMRKLEIENLASLVRFAIRHGIILP